MPAELSGSSKTGVPFSISVVLIAVVLIAMGITTARHLASETNRSAWYLKVTYTLDGKEVTENHAYTGMDDAANIAEKIIQKNGVITNAEYGNDEMGIVNHFEPEFLSEFIRRRSQNESR